MWLLVKVLVLGLAMAGVCSETEQGNVLGGTCGGSRQSISYGYSYCNGQTPLGVPPAWREGAAVPEKANPKSYA